MSQETLVLQSFQTEFLLPAHLRVVVSDTEHIFDK